MSGLIDLLKGPLAEQLIEGVTAQTGQSKNKTTDILSMAMPLLLGAMKKNASTTDGAKGLIDAVSSKHDGGILEDLGGFFGGGVDASVIEDGAGILGHVLGEKQTNVQTVLSKKSGMDTDSIAGILKIAAPIVMAALGKQAAQHKVGDAEGMTGLLDNMLGRQTEEDQSFLSSLLDSDGDGSILDDVGGMVLGNKTKKKDGLDGLLDNFF